MHRADVEMILIGVCAFVYLMCLLWDRLNEALHWEETGRDFPEYELWGRDWFDDEETEDEDD